MEDKYKKILNHYEELKDFFYKIFMDVSNYKYIVINSDRCFSLVKLFYKILYEQADEVTKQKLKSAYYALISKDAFILKYSSEAKLLEENKRSLDKVLLIDDFISGGNELTETLNKLEKYVRANLNDKITDEKIYKNLVNAIDIKVYIRDEKVINVTPKYIKKMKLENNTTNRGGNSYMYDIITYRKSLGEIPLKMPIYTALDIPNYNSHSFNKEIYDDKLIYYFNNTNAGVVVTYNYIFNHYNITPFIFLESINEKNYKLLESNIMKKWKISNEGDINIHNINLFLGVSILNLFLNEHKLAEVTYSNESDVLINHGWNNSKKGILLFQKLYEPENIFTKEELLKNINLFNRCNQINNRISLEDKIVKFHYEKNLNNDSNGISIDYRKTELINSQNSELFTLLLKGIVSLDVNTSDLFQNFLLENESIFLLLEKNKEYLPVLCFLANNNGNNKKNLINEIESKKELNDVVKEECIKLIKILSYLSISIHDFNIDMFGKNIFYEKLTQIRRVKIK